MVPLRKMKTMIMLVLPVLLMAMFYFFPSIDVTPTTNAVYFTINPVIASLVAGSVAGAIGVGVAFPLDTLKTKSQVLASSKKSGRVQTDPSSITASLLAGEDVTQMNMFELFALIYKMEGIGGFFGGVKGMMLGQGKYTHYTSHTSKLQTQVVFIPQK